MVIAGEFIIYMTWHRSDNNKLIRCNTIFFPGLQPLIYLLFFLGDTANDSFSPGFSEDTHISFFPKLNEIRLAHTNLAVSTWIAILSIFRISLFIWISRPTPFYTSQNAVKMRKMGVKDLFHVLPFSSVVKFKASQSHSHPLIFSFVPRKKICFILSTIRNMNSQ